MTYFVWLLAESFHPQLSWLQSYFGLISILAPLFTGGAMLAEGFDIILATSKGFGIST
jgi:hypothetical protein